MGRKPHGEKALSNNEKQKLYRERYNANRERVKALEAELEAFKTAASSEDALRETIKQELLKNERIAAERKLGRELAKKANQSRALGRTAGICEAAAFFLGRDRVDIAQSLLTHFMIDQEKAKAALEPDKRTKSLALESLNKSGAWKAPPKVIK